MSRKLAHAHEIANMPAAAARSSTAALNNATLPYVMALASKGYAGALRDNPHFRDGLSVHARAVTHRAAAEALGLPFTAAQEIIGG